MSQSGYACVRRSQQGMPGSGRRRFRGLSPCYRPCFLRPGAPSLRRSFPDSAYHTLRNVSAGIFVKKQEKHKPFFKKNFVAASITRGIWIFISFCLVLFVRREHKSRATRSFEKAWKKNSELRELRNRELAEDVYM